MHDPEQTERGHGPGTLPPEVEAELRRRASPTAPLPPEVEAELRRRKQQSPPPPTAAPPADEESQGGWSSWVKRLGPVGILLGFLLGKLKILAGVGKFILPALKLLKLGKILTTGGTMLLSIVVYAQRWGWWFAAGFVLTILVHEMGHVYVAWRMGVPVSAPIFIPGFGALILQKRAARSAWDEALIGIGGPVGGTIAGLVCWLAYLVTGHELMLGLAFTTFLLNLFNLIPVMPLDGGWITGAVSPRIWLLGAVGMAVLFALGFIRNPFILLLLLLSLPRLWHGLRTGDVTPEGGSPTTPRQRLVMGSAYVSLCALLAWLMANTHVVD
jgi:Zn-dependent protease